MFKLVIKPTDVQVTSDEMVTPIVLDSIANLVIAFKTGEKVLSVEAETIGVQSADLNYSRFDIVRERIPNVSKDDSDIKAEAPHIVDLSKMKIETPTQTSNKAHFRCPSCGQSAVISVNNQIVIRDLESEEETLCLTTGVELDPFDYEKAKGKVTELGVMLKADGETEGFCPICSETHKLESWIDAFERPLNYFEYEQPCPLCGCETNFVIGQNSSEVKCDNKACGYTLKGVK